MGGGVGAEETADGVGPGNGLGGLMTVLVAGAGRDLSLGEVSFTVRLRVVSLNSGRGRGDCTVSLWHCGGHRGCSRQRTDRDGWVSFGSAFPGVYSGHWPHVHFAVHSGGDDDSLLHSAQLALPGDACAKAGRSTGGMRLAEDGCFSGGWALEIPSVTGDVTRGMVATRTVGV
ncbi:hypothetical protein GCM10009828_035480 [Actinoplanes couchii]|uniref:Intradiol ring-cleavage dioxygenases domain-containing protein n=1 Tax=Actinoplanes couchii TaxID=403638 RepID=A0ABQ3X926_9ACTN|nr:hypothetical protein Aco03nite_034150 [Actinoplanes couchii]